MNLFLCLQILVHILHTSLVFVNLFYVTFQISFYSKFVITHLNHFTFKVLFSFMNCEHVSLKSLFESKILATCLTAKFYAFMNFLFMVWCLIALQANAITHFLHLKFFSPMCTVYIQGVHWLHFFLGLFRISN